MNLYFIPDSIRNYAFETMRKSVWGVTSAVGSMGLFGSYTISPFFKGISPIGVAVTCMITSAIALNVLTIEMAPAAKHISLYSAYPFALLMTNLIGRVNPIHPLIALPIGALAGGVFINLTAAFFGYSLASLKK